MSARTETSPLRAVDTPSEADVRALDGPVDQMFPLLDAKQVGDLIGFSAAYVHQLWDSGALPYVLFPRGDGRRGDSEREGRRRRIRTDHLRAAIEALPHGS